MRWLAGKLGTANNRFAISGQMGTTWGVPTYYADATCPTYDVVCKNSYGWNTSTLVWRNIRIPLEARPAINGDGELTVYDIERGRVVVLAGDVGRHFMECRSK